MNLFSGLEKFGFSGKEDLDIFGEEKKKKEKNETEVKQEAKPLEEKDFLLPKKQKCPVCDREFTTLVVKSGRLKRQEPDFDLRPNYTGVDSIKYDVTACPHCGYAAMNRFFDTLTTGQIKLIKQEVGAKFRPVRDTQEATYTYEQSIERFKLSLVSTMVKRAKLSEKAYTCLKIAWLIREQEKTMPEETEDQKLLKEAKQEEYDGFYRQAYEGFLKASSTEMPPYCGMDNNTLDFMLANMAYYYKQYDVASKLVAQLLGNSNVSARVKDKCLELKEKIMADVKKEALEKAREKQAAEEAAKKTS